MKNAYNMLIGQILFHKQGNIPVLKCIILAYKLIKTPAVSWAQDRLTASRFYPHHQSRGIFPVSSTWVQVFQVAVMAPDEELHPWLRVLSPKLSSKVIFSVSVTAKYLFFASLTKPAISHQRQLIWLTSAPLYNIFCHISAPGELVKISLIFISTSGLYANNSTATCTIRYKIKDRQ